MIHQLLLTLHETLPLAPLIVGLAALVMVMLALWLYGRSRGTTLFCLAIGVLAAGLVIGLAGIETPGQPLSWGALEDVGEDLVGPAAYRRGEQITTAAMALSLALLYFVYNMAFQETPGQRPRQMLERDEVQNKALGGAHLCPPETFRRWLQPDPTGWTVRGQFWGARGRKMGNQLCLSGEDIARGVAVFGAQGSGKTQSIILPAIADRMREGHSLIVTDVQGELQPYVQRIAARTGHTVIIHNPSQEGGNFRINLCDWIDNVADAKAMAAVLLSVAHASGNNQFWTQSATNLLAACALQYPSFGEVLDARQDHQRMAQMLKGSTKPGVADLANDFVSSVTSKDPKLGLNIMATAFNIGLAPWADPSIRRISARTDLDLPVYMTSQPTVVILRCARRHMEAYGPYLGTILRVLTTRLDDIGQAEGGPLPIPVGLILEEFPALGRLDSLVRDINLVRKRRISVLTAAQSLAQFDHVYHGKGEADQLMAGLATRVVFGGCDQRTAEFFSRSSGQQTLAVSSLSRSGGQGGRSPYSSGTASLRARALLLPDDIIRPARGHATVFAAYGEGGRAEQVIFHTQLTPLFRRKDWDLEGVKKPRAPLVMHRPSQAQPAVRPSPPGPQAARQPDRQVEEPAEALVDEQAPDLSLGL